MFHRLPVDIDETKDMGQQGDEELVTEGEYDVIYIGPLNPKRNSSVSFSVTPLPSSLTFIYSSRAQLGVQRSHIH